MGWLAQHLEDFVKPVLGYTPSKPTDYTPFFVPSEKSVIKNMWRVAKCEARRLSKPILLAGRDVFVFEILARREGYPTTFRPDISRLTVNHVVEDYSGYYLLDTGFMGSIARGLRIDSYVMASSFKTSVGRGARRLLRTETNQAFPCMTGSRSLALKIERTPKYWRTGFYRDYCKCAVPIPNPSPYSLSNACDFCCKEISGKTSGIGQEFQGELEFIRAALLTIEIYTDSSPNFVEGPAIGVSYYNKWGQPIGG